MLNILLGDGTVTHDQFWCCCVTFSVVMCGFGSSELGKESLGCVVFGGVWRDHCDVPISKFQQGPTRSTLLPLIFLFLLCFVCF